mgnify:CR=1 FL=1
MTGSLRDPRYLDVIETLKECRRDQGLTQAQLAAKVGKIQQYVSKYESCERRLDVIELVDIAAALNVSLASILDRAGLPLHTH